MIYHHLYKKLGKKDRVFAGIIGAGNYGTAIVTQEPHTPYLTVAAVADISADAAREAYEKAGFNGRQVVYCDTAERAQTEIEKGNHVYTDNCEMIAQIPIIDIVCESTGIPEASARYALDLLWTAEY